MGSDTTQSLVRWSTLIRFPAIRQDILDFCVRELGVLGGWGDCRLANSVGTNILML